MLVAIALANKMARSIWAMVTKNEGYKESGLAVAQQTLGCGENGSSACEEVSER